MKAQNLTVSVPANKCDKDCPYCISKITWETNPDQVLVQRNIPKVKRLANSAEISNVLITSKKEPFMNYDGLIWMANQFSDYWLELQTNGIELNKKPAKAARDLYKAGLNILAISIDKMKFLNQSSETLKILSKHNIVVRVCINVTEFISDIYTFEDIMRIIINVGNVSQVLFRNINYPSSTDKNNSAVKWIDRFADGEGYKSLYIQMRGMLLKKVRTIPQTGITTYSYKGISVCFSDYCIQESNKMENIRSLIFQDNGHLYTSWDDPASILF